MFKPGEVISHHEMCGVEEASLQRGMNFRLHDDHSVVLMSRRPNAPYRDEVIEDGTAIVYEGHDRPHYKGEQDPKTVDQPMKNPSGSLTQNGLFWEAARTGTRETIRVYEKIRTGTWVFNGTFELADAWQEDAEGRQVFKFRLEVAEEPSSPRTQTRSPRDRSRVVPSRVKQEVWKRDRGRCVLCGSDEELHFDHDLPFSRGGSSSTQNIRLLCAQHNLEKGARIE